MTKNYSKSLSYFILSLFISAVNDTFSKYLLTTGLSPIQVTWGRFSMGTLLLLLYGGASKKITFPIQYVPRHFLRGFLLGTAHILWVYSLSRLPVTTATAMGFTIPLFVFLLSPLFLKQAPTSRLWLPTATTLLGMLFLLRPPIPTMAALPGPLALLTSVLFFALLDVFNKKYIHEQTFFSMIFYATLVAALLTTPFACAQWHPLTVLQLTYLLLLGLGGNLIIYTLLKAYEWSDLLPLAPIRYLEFIISMFLNYCVFHHIPTRQEIYGVLLIIASVLFIIHDQSKEKEKSKEL